MRKVKITLLACLLVMAGRAQQPDTPIKKLDSLSKKTYGADGQQNNTSRGAYNEDTRLTASTYFLLLGSDIKQAFTKPFHMKGRDWRYAGLFAAGMVALNLADEPMQRFALRARNENPTLRNTSNYITSFGGLYEAYMLGALGAYGFLFHQDKMKTTTLLATQAYVTGALVESVLKTLSGRQRPYVVDPGSVEAEPTFHGPLYNGGRDAGGKKLNSSFPSGHTTVAFAAATVFALEYRNKPFIPIIAYSAATLIGLSRITENKHWATDVVAGAALGHPTGRQVVKNYHRYAKLKAPQQNRSTFRFNPQYNFGRMMPGLVHTFG